VGSTPSTTGTTPSAPATPNVRNETWCVANQSRFWQCGTGDCPDGFHTGMTGETTGCARPGSTSPNQTFCAAFGLDFWKCGFDECPAGYHSGSYPVAAAPAVCVGTRYTTSCVPNNPRSFYSCETSCPQGYRASQGPNVLCAPFQRTQILCCNPAMTTCPPQ
jgi:hypothetical protein